MRAPPTQKATWCALGRAVRDEVSGAEVGLRQPLTCLLLLVRVPRHEAPARSKRHVDEAGTVDPGGRHATPLVPRAEQRACVLDGVGGGRAEPVGIGLAADVRPPHPAGIGVRGLDLCPLATLVDHPQRLPGESLCDLLGLLRRLGAERRQLASERMFA